MARGRAPARAAQRGHPDHHGRRASRSRASSRWRRWWRRAFGLNGLGAYLVQAAQNKDFAVVQGISLVLVFAFVITNVVIDIAYALLDPRVTLGSRAQ